MRMIEMIGELVRAILGLIKQGKYEEAYRSIENAYRDILKEDAAFFSSIPPEKLTDTLLREHNYTSGHLEVLSELFYAQAEWFHAQDREKESLLYYRKALILLEFVMAESKVFSLGKQARLAYLKKRLSTR